MAKVGRPPNLIPTTEWKLKIPVDIAAKIDLLTWDPVKQTPAYGARSALVIQLLRAHLASLAISVDKLEEDGHDVHGDINPLINLPENDHD